MRIHLIDLLPILGSTFIVNAIRFEDVQLRESFNGLRNRIIFRIFRIVIPNLKYLTSVWIIKFRWFPERFVFIVRLCFILNFERS